MNVLFVCLGNICRSPTAEGVFRQRLQQAGLGDCLVDSAGTAGWHEGKSPDARTCLAARRRGYELESLRARQFRVEDFQRFDLILAMDRSNLAHLTSLRPRECRAQIDLLLARYDLDPAEVPDPYYGGKQGFEQVLDLIEQACDGLLEEVRRARVAESV